jgi:hypothetical protein
MKVSLAKQGLVLVLGEGLLFKSCFRLTSGGSNRFTSGTIFVSPEKILC